jgi:hypothetical protein
VRKESNNQQLTRNETHLAHPVALNNSCRTVLRTQMDKRIEKLNSTEVAGITYSYFINLPTDHPLVVAGGPISFRCWNCEMPIFDGIDSNEIGGVSFNCGGCGKFNCTR